MSYAPVITGLYTTVQNTSGQTRVFGFLGAHGRRLAANDTYTVPGDLVAALGGGSLNTKKSTRQFKALERALADGDLTIVRSPAVYLSDTVTDETLELALTGGELGVVDPQWSPEVDEADENEDEPVVDESSSESV